MIEVLILLFIPGIIVLFEFARFLLLLPQRLNSIIFRGTEIASLILLPLLYVSIGDHNDCCGNSAVFSPEHRLSILVVILLCLAAYFYSSYRTQIATPVMEVIVNTFLLIGIILNCFIAVHTNDIWLTIGGNMPIILLYIMVLVKNQRAYVQYAKETLFVPGNAFEKIAWKILNFRPALKYPVFVILCLPILIILALLLLLLGQKPDSFIRAFTDTYKHGLSQWDYKCDNVNCGGHYLCSVAAKGHKKIVKPQRWGVRNGGEIICNRQLLISNAFEELLQEKAPVVHKLIRIQYNRTGNFIHRYYHIFNIKIVSDLIYLFMKPLEWSFLVVLYTFDRNPENRIAKQYISSDYRKIIDSYSKTNRVDGLRQYPS